MTVSNSYSNIGLAAVDNSGNIGLLSGEVSGLTSSGSSSVYGNFEGGTLKHSGLTELV